MPSPTQEAGLLDHCGHARFMWNLALEQWSMWAGRAVTARRAVPSGTAAKREPQHATSG
ncbi:helix-turn-helix domain-containing protein [Actinopolymorpha alba]|uniref:helix-turn-helix domain-containing protein n=1 Tax=Actinopolymorpha alba TaxID=533267 RepID=UPI002351D992|nr:helix-turn-helix domain-containing protein [Actinopolymorpha alba]